MVGVPVDEGDLDRVGPDSELVQRAGGADCAPQARQSRRRAPRSALDARSFRSPPSGRGADPRPAKLRRSRKVASAPAISGGCPQCAMSVSDVVPGSCHVPTIRTRETGQARCRVAGLAPIVKVDVFSLLPCPCVFIGTNSSPNFLARLVPRLLCSRLGPAASRSSRDCPMRPLSGLMAWCRSGPRPRTRDKVLRRSASACASQNDMSMSRYMAAAAVKSTPARPWRPRRRWSRARPSLQ